MNLRQRGTALPCAESMPGPPSTETYTDPTPEHQKYFFLTSQAHICHHLITEREGERKSTMTMEVDTTPKEKKKKSKKEKDIGDMQVSLNYIG